MTLPMDLTGQRFGRLLVVEKDEPFITKSGQKQVRWLCQCDCGNTTSVSTAYLRNGKTKSCGCLQRDRAKEANTKHGDYKNRLYLIYKKMINRCTDEKTPCYKNYGGRGITVCDEWKNDYLAFKEWALSHGYSDDLSIDRIDVNGNYEPDNCRWADDFIQNNNTRRNVNITFNGETHSLSVWGRIKPNGLGYDTLRSRLRDGWSIEKAFTTPKITNKPDNKGKHITINGETHNVTWWCKKTGIDKCTFYRRIERGWSIERAATEPHDERRLRKKVAI